MSNRHEILTRTTPGECPDPRPVEVPISARATAPTIREEMQRYIRTLVSEQAEKNQQESFEESNDFEIDESEDTDMLTNYTVNEMAAEPGSVELDGDPNAPEPLEVEGIPPAADDSSPGEPRPATPSIPDEPVAEGNA